MYDKLHTEGSESMATWEMLDEEKVRWVPGTDGNETYTWAV